MKIKKIRCEWANVSDLYIEYHDHEWGVPHHNDLKLFEFLLLEGAQAGLSWLTILKKRINYRKAFDDFDPEKIANYDEKKVQDLLLNNEIIRNKLKIISFINNARAFLAIKRNIGSFDKYIWQFVGNKPKTNAWKSTKEIPSTTDESKAMSQDLKKHGFTFIGPTICYAFMQATGMVNDHVVDCFRYVKINSNKFNRTIETPIKKTS